MRLSVSFKDIYELIDGDRGANYPKKEDYLESGYCLFLSTKNVRPNGFIFNEKVFISQKKHEQLRNGTLQRGDIVLTTRGTVGNVGIYDDSVAYNIVRINSGMLILRSNKNIIHAKFLLYYLQSPLFIFQLHNSKSGTAQPQLPIGILKNLIIPIFGSNEQKAIVEKIERLFSELDNGIENLKKVQAQLKVYRQAVLKRAFEGNLTKEWREKQKDLLSADKILEKIIKEKETLSTKQKNKESMYPDNKKILFNIPKEWLWVTLNDISNKITDGEHFKPKTVEKGVYFLSAKDIHYTGLSFNDPLFISEETANKSRERCNPEKNDILIVSRGAGVGRLCIVNTEKLFCLLGSVILIKTNSFINSKWLSYILKSPFINQELRDLSGSTAQQAIYLRDIKNVILPLCSIEEQNQIVQEIERRLSMCDNVEAIIEQSLKKADSLRQSILKKAFEGKLLTEKELEEVRKSPDWEPAEKLLERIKAEKESEPKPVKKTKAKKEK